MLVNGAPTWPVGRRLSVVLGYAGGCWVGGVRIKLTWAGVGIPVCGGQAVGGTPIFEPPAKIRTLHFFTLLNHPPIKNTQ